MGSVNRTIIASTIILMATGFYWFFLHHDTTHTTMTRIIVGGYLLGLFASVFDLIGFGIGQLAGWILLLAVGVAITAVAADLAGRFATPANQYGGTNPHTTQA